MVYVVQKYWSYHPLATHEEVDRKFLAQNRFYNTNLDFIHNTSQETIFA